MALVIGLGSWLAVELVLAGLVLGILLLVNSGAVRLQAGLQRPSVHGRDFFRT
jgi:hypothetical protein